MIKKKIKLFNQKLNLRMTKKIQNNNNNKKLNKNYKANLKTKIYKKKII